RARLQSDALDRRRTNHRARRDHPGADSRPDAGAQSAHRSRRDPDHAQSRHRGGNLPPRDRDVCGPQDRGGRRHRAVRPACAPLHARPDGFDPAAARQNTQAPPRRNPRHRAVTARADRRLRLRAALRLCGRALPRRDAGAAPDRRRPRRRLPRGRARAHDGGGGMSPVIEVENLKKHFSLRRGLLARAVAMVKAVDGVSFAINPGETLCLVGESGCGKSTVGKLLLRRSDPTAGALRLDWEDITHLGVGDMRPHRKRMQMVFQDPYASLNPRLAAGRIVSEPLENYSDISPKEREARTAELFEKVGLRADAMRRYPFEFSGGQRQRLGIARALALNPAVIIADEPVSALEVSVQAQVLTLMMDLQAELGLAYLFVSHDLAVVEHIGHRVAVMYLGKIVE